MSSCMGDEVWFARRDVDDARRDKNRWDGFASENGDARLVPRQSQLFEDSWSGGSASVVFNKLEEIANSERPRTPALGCGVTWALSKECFPNEFGSAFQN